MHNNIKPILNNSDFKLVELLGLYLGYKYILFIILIFFTGISFYKYASLPIEYESVAIKLQESNSPSSSKLTASGIPGFDFGGLASASSALSSDLYPDLLENKTFLLDLGDQIYFIPSQNDSMSLRYYLLNNKSETIVKLFSESPKQISKYKTKSNEYLSKSHFKNSSFSKDKILKLNSEDESIINNLKSRIKIELDGKKIILTCRMPDPVLSAKVNNLVFEKIVQYIYDYEQEKQRKSLEFIISRLNEAENNFKSAQFKLAKYRDSNIEVSSEVVNIQEQRLQSDYDLSFQIYSSLKQELENSKIQLNKEASIFRTFEYAYVPNSPIHYSLFKYIGFGIFLGIFVWFLLVSCILCVNYFKD